MSVDTTAIRTEGLAKDYRAGFWRRRVRVLHGLNLQVQVGEVFGFLGPNGAGKTTTLKLLTGLIHPTAGSATILGEPAGTVGVKARIGFLPENPYFYDYLTGSEFLDYCGSLAGLPRAVRRDRVQSLLAQMGLSRQGSLQLRKYSKGMLQRIGLAQALINEPAVIFLDEPMSGLDPIGRKEVRDLILHLREQGRTVFFSTHIIPDVEVVCDRVGIILAGRLAAVGHVEELLASPLEQIEVTASGLQPEDEAAIAAQERCPTGAERRRYPRRCERGGGPGVRPPDDSGSGRANPQRGPPPPHPGGGLPGPDPRREPLKTGAVAFNTFREAIRDRILYSLLVFALAMIGGSLVLSTLSVGGEVRIIKDLGLAAIGLVGTLIAVFIGVGLVHKEIERRTLYAIITKPIRRAEFVLGKFLGLALTLAVNVTIMGAGLLFLASAMEARVAWERLLPVGLTFLKLMVVTAIAVLFSTFSTPTLMPSAPWRW